MAEKRQLEKKEIILLSVVGLIGVISAIFGFIAEPHRIKSSEVKITSNQCVYPSSNPASALATVAAILLIVAQIILLVLSQCGCCKKNPNRSCGSCTCIVVSLVFSWIAFVVAEVSLVSGAVLDSQRGTVNKIDGDCPLVPGGEYIWAGSLVLVSVILGLTAAHKMLTLPTDSASSMNIPTGQPIGQDPVFASENAYKK